MSLFLLLACRGGVDEHAWWNVPWDTGTLSPIDDTGDDEDDEGDAISGWWGELDLDGEVAELGMLVFEAQDCEVFFDMEDIQIGDCEACEGSWSFTLSEGETDGDCAVDDPPATQVGYAGETLYAGSEWEAAGFAEKEDDWFFFAWDEEEDDEEDE